MTALGMRPTTPLLLQRVLGNDLQVAGHVELSAFFQKAHGRQGLSGGYSWAGAGPEVRAIGSDVHGVAAH